MARRMKRLGSSEDVHLRRAQFLAEDVIENAKVVYARSNKPGGCMRAAVAVGSMNRNLGRMMAQVEEADERGVAFANRAEAVAKRSNEEFIERCVKRPLKMASPD